MKKRGFTLIELLIVIAIIAILAAVITPNVSKSIEKSKVSRTTSDLKNMRTAALQYYSDLGFFPPDIGPGTDPGLGAKPGNKTTQDDSMKYRNLTVAHYNDMISKFWQGPYLEYSLSKKNAWGSSYDYECWWPGRIGFPEGIWITIHGIPAKSADMLVNNCSFTVRDGDPRTDDLNSNLKKVSLKIADWQN